MPDTLLKQAIKEAYASAPSGVVIYHTIELRHPAFVQPLRVVRDQADLTATLEATAPVNPGEPVTFVALAFDFSKPEVSASGSPQVTIEIDNVGREMVTAIEAAMTTLDLIEVTYREYLSTDLTGPQNDPPMTLIINSITADVFKVRASATFGNVANKRFPNQEYSAERFPGLVQ